MCNMTDSYACYDLSIWKEADAALLHSDEEDEGLEMPEEVCGESSDVEAVLAEEEERRWRQGLLQTEVCACVCICMCAPAVGARACSRLRCVCMRVCVVRVRARARAISASSCTGLRRACMLCVRACARAVCCRREWLCVYPYIGVSVCVYVDYLCTDLHVCDRSCGRLRSLRRYIHMGLCVRVCLCISFVRGLAYVRHDSLICVT